MIAAAKALQDELLAPSLERRATDPLEAEARVAAARKTALLLLGPAMQTYGDKLSDQQEVLMLDPDILIDTFAAESAVLRALQSRRGRGTRRRRCRSTRRGCSSATPRCASRRRARRRWRRWPTATRCASLLAALRRLLKVAPVNTVTIRRRIAHAAVEKGGYPLYSR